MPSYLSTATGEEALVLPVVAKTRPGGGINNLESLLPDTLLPLIKSQDPCMMLHIEDIDPTCMPKQRVIIEHQQQRVETWTSLFKSVYSRS